MLTDPLSVTYNSVSKSLVRITSYEGSTRYRTADGEFEVLIESQPSSQGRNSERRTISLARRIPDPTPSNVFDDYREIRNVFGLSYEFDLTRSETSVDIPLLRTALLAFVDSTLQGRIISGEQ
jgi:hypothetical protein